MKVSVIQPSYYAGEKPDEKIAEFLKEKVKNAEDISLIVMPEYSNAGGLSDKDEILKAEKSAEELLAFAADTAKEKHMYIAVNVLEKRDKELKNSTYLFLKNGEVGFVYDKLHLPPSEVNLGIKCGNGDCTFEADDIRFAFMTCYDVYFNEQIEKIARFKPDIIIISGYQRGERTDIIRAQAKLAAFRCNAYLLRSSYSMESDEFGGCSMIVAPDGEIIADIGKEVGVLTAEIDEKAKYMRPAGFGQPLIPNDEFITNGCVINDYNLKA